MIQPTSEQAAAANLPHVEHQREVVFNHIVSCREHGATNQETEQATQILTSAVTARCRDLAKSGHVRDSGKTRKNCRDKNVIVWVATGKLLSDDSPVQRSLLDPPPRTRATSTRPLAIASPAASPPTAHEWPTAAADYLLQLSVDDLPPAPFKLDTATTVVDPWKYLASLQDEIRRGPTGPRARNGSLQATMKLLCDLLRRSETKQ
jgi:hypothetical protein